MERSGGPASQVVRGGIAVGLGDFGVLHEAVADALADLDATPLHRSRPDSASTNPGIWTQRSPLGSCVTSTFRPWESCSPSGWFTSSIRLPSGSLMYV